MLTKMEDPNGDWHIDFQYESYESSYTAKKVQTREDKLEDASTASNKYGQSNSSSESIVSIQGKRIKSISNNRGDVVTFTYGNNIPGYMNGSADQRLEEVTVSKHGHLVKTIKLSFNNAAGRMQLASVQEFGDDGLAIAPAYQFGYMAGSLPPRLSKNQDFWGFYNGANNSVSYPSITYNGQEYSGANRQPDFDFAKIGVLEKVTYPTGGEAIYKYESHSYYNIDLNEQANNGTSSVATIKTVFKR